MVDADRLVDSIGEQTALLGLERVNQSLTREGAFFDHIKRSTVEREPAGIADPERAKRPWCTGAPQRYFFCLNFGVYDRHQRGMVLQDRDLFLEVVLEEIAQILTTSARLHLLCHLLCN